MGVPGLWDIIRPAGKPRSLIHLGVIDGFEQNSAGKRGYRVGIDASIWFFHAEWGREGENPQLRTLFFRLARLLESPFLPLFVFDGPHRPSVKRGRRISGGSHALIPGMKKLIDAFGFEWRQAPGEAEAELAHLNKIGFIDAVLSDDVDTFLFGAQVVVRNPSATLSGNKSNPVKNADGRDDGKHVVIYRASKILEHEDIQLTQAGMILMGLLAGGDYNQTGIKNCGKNIAHGLARCGFGEELIHAVQSIPEQHIPKYLDAWRDAVRNELRTNSRGFLGSRHIALAGKIPDDFPDLEVLKSYIEPVTSARLPNGKEVRIDDSSWWTKEPNLGDIAGCCELFFEWGIKDIIIKRFRTVIWPGACLRILRRAALEQDAKQRTRASGSRPTSDLTSTPKKSRANHLKDDAAIGTPSKLITKYFSSLKLNSPDKRSGNDSDEDEEDENPLMVRIHSSRQHASTDGILEYRVEIAPAHLVALAEAGVQGLRKAENKGINSGASGTPQDMDDEDYEYFNGAGKGKAPPEPDSHIRVWLPASMMTYVQPDLVEVFEDKEAAKLAKKTKKAEKATVKAGGGKTTEAPTKSKALATKKASKVSSKKPVEYSEEEEEEVVVAKPKPKTKAARPVTPTSDEANLPKPRAKPPKPAPKPKPEKEKASSSKTVPPAKAAAKVPKASTLSRARHAFDLSSDDEPPAHVFKRFSSPELSSPTSRPKPYRPPSPPAPHGTNNFLVSLPPVDNYVSDTDDHFSADRGPEDVFAEHTSSTSLSAANRLTSATSLSSARPPSKPTTSTYAQSGSKSKSRSASSRTSESDSNGDVGKHATPRKSPRKSKLQVSPDRRGEGLRTTTNSSVDVIERPGSPSPQPKRMSSTIVGRAAPRPPAKPLPKSVEYIEISSDEGDKEVLAPIPLKFASKPPSKARTASLEPHKRDRKVDLNSMPSSAPALLTTKTKPNKTAEKAKPSTYYSKKDERLKIFDDEDVIDLT